ncbi:MAG: hypothetical protein E6Q32_05335 [Neisseriales bacterium]|nr:MAG: hypothetical protein E6Q32_05335 [Neisseriales bacterium]
MFKIVSSYLRKNMTKNLIKLFFIVLFSCAIDFSFTGMLYPGYTIITVLIFYLLNIYNHIIFRGFVIFLGIMASVYIPIRFVYGTLSLGMMISILATNKTESIEFLQNIPVIYFGLSLVLCFLTIFVQRIKLRYLRSKITHVTWFIVVVFFILATIISIHKKERLIFFPSAFFFDNINFLYNQASSLQRQMSDDLKKPSDWKPVIKETNYDTFVIVLGESARKDFLHAYGFNLNNTPFMDNAMGTLYSKYYSSGPNTFISVPHSLCLERVQNKVEYNNTIITLAKSANFNTYWISNQGTYGQYDLNVAFIGKRADSSYFSSTVDYTEKNISDMQLLPHLESALSNTSNKKKLIVLHLMGSHPDFCDRTNGQYDDWYVSKKLSCYVKSIFNTDLFLKNVVSTLDSNHKKWTLMYFSGHGLRMLDAGTSNATMIHSAGAQQDYNVPLFITYYNSKQHIIDNGMYSAMNFISMFATWIGVEDNLIPKKCNPLSKVKCSLNQINAYDGDEKLQDVLSLPNEEIR